MSNRPDKRSGRPILKGALAFVGGAVALLVALLLAHSRRDVREGGSNPHDLGIAEHREHASARAPNAGPFKIARRFRPDDSISTLRLPPAPGEQEPQNARQATNPYAQSTALWANALADGRQQLADYDPTLRNVMGAITYQLQEGSALDDCGFARARQLGHSWGFQTSIALTAKVESGQLTFSAIDFEKHGLPNDADESFHRCVAGTLPTLKFPCQGCRAGEVSFRWGLNRSFHMHEDGRAYTSDEVRAEAKAKGFGSADDLFLK